MQETFRRIRNITSLRRRRQFYRRVIDRFEEEWAIAVLQEPDGRQELDPSRLQNEAGMMVVRAPEEEILKILGEALPTHKVDQLLKVYEFSHKQLPSAERVLLPSPADKRKHRAVGNTVFRAGRRAVWRALCDPTSDTYKMWYEKGLMFALDQKVLGAAVGSALTGLGIGIYAFAIPITALVIKLGVDVVCELWSADGLMIGLDESTDA